jgi:8-oxo-dGTP diphosphatase
MSPAHVVLDVNTNNVMAKSINPDKHKNIEVSVGIVINQQGQLLVAKRPDHWLGGGFWEFPGGKIEPMEDSETALKRELLEEVGIIVQDCAPLINLSYTYPERTVRLNAWWVSAYTGNVAGLEGQEICWRDRHSLNDLNMLPANRAIVVATQLPDTYLITPECHNSEDFLLHLENLLENKKIKLLQLRSKELSQDNYLRLAEKVAVLCRKNNVSLILNHDGLDLTQLNCDGVHLSARQLMSLNERPVPKNKWLGASCHNEQELKKAEQIGVDFVTISPVNATVKSDQALGWDVFRQLVAIANIPVYALGGMTPLDLAMAKDSGAQGIAATRSLWHLVEVRV